MITNEQITSNEKKWLNKMLMGDVPYKNEIVKQINKAQIYREYTQYYLCLKFINSDLRDEKIVGTGVLVEMRAYFKEEVPIQFLLHIVKGAISELEIFRADSSLIEQDINLDEMRCEVICSEQWKE